MPLRGAGSRGCGQVRGARREECHTPGEQLLPDVCLVELVPRQLLVRRADLAEPPVDKVAHFQHPCGGEFVPGGSRVQNVFNVLLRGRQEWAGRSGATSAAGCTAVEGAHTAPSRGMLTAPRSMSRSSSCTASTAPAEAVTGRRTWPQGLAQAHLPPGDAVHPRRVVLAKVEDDAFALNTLNRLEDDLCGDLPVRELNLSQVWPPGAASPSRDDKDESGKGGRWAPGPGS